MRSLHCHLLKIRLFLLVLQIISIRDVLRLLHNAPLFLSILIYKIIYVYIIINEILKIIIQLLLCQWYIPYLSLNIEIERLILIH